MDAARWCFVLVCHTPLSGIGEREREREAKKHREKGRERERV